MSYCITSNGYKPGYIVERNFIDNYRAKDYIAPLYYLFGKRLPGSNLTFDNIAAATRYIDTSNLIPNTWYIVEYDSCMNALINNVYNSNGEQIKG